MRDGAAIRKAVALRYRQAEEAAPRVVAKGNGVLADRILEIAEREGVAVRHDSSLVEVLGALEVDEVIPVELYEALARVLSWVYEQDRKRGRSRRS
jgi:flagellar biosynthesis protein